jgi:hypothetical protein
LALSTKSLRTFVSRKLENDVKDSEIRGLLLEAFYDKRDDPHPYRPQPSDFGDRLTELQIFRISQQLEQQGLIQGAIKALMGGDGGGVVFAKITAFGADVIEGEVEAPFAIRIMNTYNISHSNNVAIGDHNQQQQAVVNCITELVRVIDGSDATPQAKAEAKGLLRKFLEHPLVSAVAGALASAALGS